jgi:hypothetical protein
MLKAIQVNTTKNRMYAMDENCNVIAEYEVGKDFWPGQNAAGQAYCNAPNGVYHIKRENVYADGPYSEDGSRDLNGDVKPFGWGYIGLDDRGHAIHGGGSNLGWPHSDAPMQELTKTNGCFRAHNVNIYDLALLAIESLDNKVDLVVTVVS